MHGLGRNMTSQASGFQGQLLPRGDTAILFNPVDLPCKVECSQSKNSYQTFILFTMSRNRSVSLRWIVPTCYSYNDQDASIRFRRKSQHSLSIYKPALKQHGGQEGISSSERPVNVDGKRKPQMTSSAHQMGVRDNDNEDDHKSENHGFRIWRKDGRNYDLEDEEKENRWRSLRERRRNNHIWNPRKAFPSNPRYLNIPKKPRNTLRINSRNFGHPSDPRNTSHQNKLWIRKHDEGRSTQNASEQDDSTLSGSDEGEEETYLRRLLNARLASTSFLNFQHSKSYIQEADEKDEDHAQTISSQIYTRRRYSEPEVPAVRPNVSSDEKALRQALKIRRQETQEVLREQLVQASLSKTYSRTVVEHMPGFVDHIMIQAVALKSQERYVTSTFVARARVCAAQTKMVELVKWMKHNHITVPRVGRLIDMKGKQLDQLRERISFLKRNYVRGRDLGVVLTRQPVILDRPWAELCTIVQLLEEAGVRREWVGFVICRSPGVLGLSVNDLLDKIAFFQNLGITPEQLGAMAFNFPACIGHFPLSEMQTKVEYLRHLGMVDSNIGKAIAASPQLLACDVDEAWRPIVKFFQFLGVERAGILQILCVHPSVFCMNLENNIAPKAIGVREEVIGQVIVEFPAFLSYSLDRKIRPVVKFLLEEAGVKEVDVGKVIALRPQLIGTSMTGKLQPMVTFFINQQFKRQDLGVMVADFPMLLKYNVAVIQPKFRYFKKGMKRSLDDLISFPRYFSYSLEHRIIPRQRILRANGLVFHLRYMLGCNDDIFAERVGAALQGRLRESPEEELADDANSFDLDDSTLQENDSSISLTRDADFLSVDTDCLATIKSMNAAATEEWAQDSLQIDSTCSDLEQSSEADLIDEDEDYETDTAKSTSSVELVRGSGSFRNGEDVYTADEDNNENDEIYNTVDDLLDISEDEEFLLKYCV